MPEDDLVSGLSLAVGLRVFDGARYVGNVQVAVEVSEALVYELATIVSYDCVGDSIAADDVLPNEALDLVGRDGG